MGINYRETGERTPFPTARFRRRRSLAGRCTPSPLGYFHYGWVWPAAKRWVAISWFAVALVPSPADADHPFRQLSDQPRFRRPVAVAGNGAVLLTANRDSDSITLFDVIRGTRLGEFSIGNRPTDVMALGGRPVSPCRLEDRPLSVWEVSIRYCSLILPVSRPSGASMWGAIRPTSIVLPMAGSPMWSTSSRIQ